MVRVIRRSPTFKSNAGQRQKPKHKQWWQKTQNKKTELPDVLRLYNKLHFKLFQEKVCIYKCIYKECCNFESVVCDCYILLITIIMILYYIFIACTATAKRDALAARARHEPSAEH